jgi:hypothetical protein
VAARSRRYIDDFVADMAAQGGAVHVLEWLQQQQGIEFTESTMTFAAMRGHLQLCQWLCAQQCPWVNSAVTGAAIGNHCEVLQWLMDDAHKVCTTAAAGSDSNNFSTLQFLYACGILTEPQLLTDTLNVAGSRGNLAASQWLRQQGAEWPTVLRFTALSRNFQWSGEVLAWARAEGCTAPTEQ